MKNTFSSLSFSFNRNLSKLSPRFHACVVSIHWSPAFVRARERFTADRDVRANIEWEGRGMDFNKPEAYCAFVRLSLSTERLLSARGRGMNAAGPLCSTATRKKTAKRQQPCRVRVVGGWRTWAKRTQTLGVALLQWRWLRLASELLPLFFFLFFLLPPSPFFCTKFTEWFRPVEMPSRSRVLLSPWPRVSSLSIVPFPTIWLIASLKPRS